MSAARAKVSKLIAKSNKAFSQLADAFTEYKSNKDLDALKQVQQRVSTILQTIQDSLSSSEYAFDAEFAKKLITIGDLFKQKLELVKKEHEAVIGFFEGEATDESKAKLTKNVAALVASLGGVDEKIKSTIKKL